MIHNDILRRLRYALAINDTAAISIFELAGYEMQMEYLHSIMKKEEEAGFVLCRDKILSIFLDGLIMKLRGKQEGREPVMLAPGVILTNNDILRKMRIALTLKDDDILNIMKLADFKVSKGEVSAFFRNTEHRNYKPCGNQFLRNFLQGLTKRERPQDSRWMVLLS